MNPSLLAAQSLPHAASPRSRLTPPHTPNTSSPRAPYLRGAIPASSPPSWAHGLSLHARTFATRPGMLGLCAHAWSRGTLGLARTFATGTSPGTLGLAHVPAAGRRPRQQKASPARAQAGLGADVDEAPSVVIAGAGVAGLATALALHRVGIRSLVVERSPGRPQGGAALSLWGNAWRALDALGVGPTLRRECIAMDEMEILNSDGKLLRSFSILKDCDTGSTNPHEVRGVQRAELLRALEEELPAGTVLYSTQIASFQEAGDGQVTVHLRSNDGSEESIVTTQALIGCDGANAATAKALGLPPVRYVGYVAARGLARLDPAVPAQAALASSLLVPPGAAGQDGPVGRIRLLWGRGVRAGIYPMTPTLFYWFTCANYKAQGPAFSALDELKTDKAKQREEALTSVRGWGGGIRAFMDATPDEDISTYPLTDRWDFAALFGGRIGAGHVTLAGDAAHPMTPNLGQGACTALEDAVVLAQHLSSVAVDSKAPAGASLAAVGSGQAQRSTQHVSESGGTRTLKGRAVEVEKALAAFEQTRAKRVTPLVLRSNAIGSILQIENPLVCLFRDSVVMPHLFQPSHFLDHALFDCGKLPQDPRTTATALSS